MSFRATDPADSSITAYMAEHGMTASEVVTKLRAQVEETTGLTISAGIAPNRMLAKVCCPISPETNVRSAQIRTSRTGSTRWSSAVRPSSSSCATCLSGQLFAPPGS